VDLDKLLTFPRKRDPLIEAEWYDASGLEAGEQEDWDTAAEAELPPELEPYQILADADDKFDEHWSDWLEYVCDHGILLPIEQSCEDGVLLPIEQRAMRLATCPEEMLRPLRWFFEESPRHVRLLLCHYIYWLVRLERGRRLGTGHWRPGLSRSGQNSA
jgi:hypothetical protein